MVIITITMARRRHAGRHHLTLPFPTLFLSGLFAAGTDFLPEGSDFFLFGNCLYYRSSNVQSLAKQKYHYNPLYMGIQLHPHPRKKHDPHNENRLSGCWRLLAAVGGCWLFICPDFGLLVAEIILSRLCGA